MTGFRTSSDATRQLQRERSNVSARPLTAKRSDRLVPFLRDDLARLRESNPNTPKAYQYGYGLVEMETDRVFREIDALGRLHLVDQISGDEIDGVFAYIYVATEEGLVYPGNFPGQVRPDGTIFSGRFSQTGSDEEGLPENSKVKLSDGRQLQADEELVADTSLDASFIGRGLSYATSRLSFKEGRFNGDPGLKVIARARRIVDPRTASNSLAFADQPKTFSVNNYRFVFDYLIRPRTRGGAGVPISRVDIQSFILATDWAENLIDTQQFSRTGVLTTRTNQNTGIPPINTNHLIEFNESVVPFQYGDVIQINVAGNQEFPSNLSGNTDYHVVPIRDRINDFQLPAIALAETLADALNGNTIPQGSRATDITITKVKETRFQGGAVYRAGQAILGRLLESCGASLFLKNGKIAITRQVFPDDDDIQRVELAELIGSISISTALGSDERATSLTGSYRSLTNLFVPQSYPRVSGGGVFESQDGEATLKEYDLPFVSKASIAQRLATVELRRRRQEFSVAFSGDLSMYRLRPGTVFSLDFSRYGLDEQTTFEVRDQTFFQRVVRDIPTFGIDIRARQLEKATFDLDLSAEEFVSEADIPGLQSPFEVPSPGQPNVTEQQFQTRDGSGVKSRVNITWAASPGLFVTRYEVSFKLSSEETFFFLAQIPAPEALAQINDLAPNRYDFRVVAINSVGRRSEPAETLNVEVLGLSARPSAPTGFKGQVLGAATVLLRWDRSGDLDVREGGFVEIRHDPAVTGAEAKNSIFIDSDVGGQTSLAVAFKQGTYFLRFEDSAGQFSDPIAWSTQSRRPVGIAQVPTGVGGALEDVPGGDPNLFTLQEDPAFSSPDPSNTLIVVGGDHLELPLEATLDDEPNFDAIPNMDEVGGGAVTPSGLYVFTTSVEIDAVARVLVEAVLETEVFDLSSSLDDEADFDSIPNIDNVAATLLQPGLATAEIEVRFSNDTVVADTFGPWETIDTQFIEARSFQFRVFARSFVPTVNIRVNQARVRIKAVPL